MVNNTVRGELACEKKTEALALELFGSVKNPSMVDLKKKSVMIWIAEQAFSLRMAGGRLIAEPRIVQKASIEP